MSIHYLPVARAGCNQMYNTDGALKKTTLAIREIEIPESLKPFIIPFVHETGKRLIEPVSPVSQGMGVVEAKIVQLPDNHIRFAGD